ncbi:MAG: SOS response-associated peptidase [Pseudomonadota bacterium]
MPGRLFLDAAPAEIASLFGVAFPGPLAPRRNIAPGQEILVFDGEQVNTMRWGILPVGRTNARGRPVMETLINARSETVFQKSAFAGTRRGVVPARGWYEWTGERRRKKAWQIQAKSGNLLCFAAIWDIWQAPGGRDIAQVATLTCPPNADVRDIHDRMGVLLEPQSIAKFLKSDADEVQDLLVPAPDGSLSVAPAKNVDWDGP